MMDAGSTEWDQEKGNCSLGYLKRLLREPGPSEEDLRRQADEEIKQIMSGNSPPSDMPANGMAPEAHSSSQEAAAN